MANWCEQFGLTEEEKEQESPLGRKESVTKGRDNLSVNESFLTSEPSHEVQLLVSPPKMASGNSLQENILCFETLSDRIQFSEHLTRTTVMGNLFHYGGNTHILEQTLIPESLQQFLGEQSLDQFWKFKS